MASHLELLLVVSCVSSISGLVPTEGILDSKTPSLRFFPDTEVKLIQLETRRIQGTGEVIGENLTEILVTSADRSVAEIVGNSSILLEYIDCLYGDVNVSGTTDDGLSETSRCFNFSVEVHGVFIGLTSLLFHPSVSGTPLTELPVSYNIVVVRAYNILSEIFTYGIILLLSVNTVGFGCSINLDEMKTILKRPIAPLIGLACQFILNPLLAYSFGLAYGLSPALALGLFSLGCCPGGGGSNMWTYLLGGDLDLSILMTFCSTLVCFGMLPLWMYTLGKTLIPDSLQLPFANIFYSLLGLVVPCLIGILINKYAPKVAVKIRKIIKPMVVLFLILVFSVGIYTNLYMFTIMKNWRVLVSGFSVPFSAYITSACVALVLRRSRKHVLTISIETAIQNTGIAIVLILTTFPQPIADIAAVMPIAAVMFTPLPLVCLLVIRKTIRKKCSKSDENGRNEEKNKEMETTKEAASLGEANQSYDDIETDKKKTDLSLTSVV